MNYYGQIRSPETKSEVKLAARVLFGLGILFLLSAFFGVVMRIASRDNQWFILILIFGGFAPILFAAGAYNIYYTRRMQHHPFMETALRHSTITVIVIMAILFVVVFGGIGLLIYTN